MHNPRKAIQIELIWIREFYACDIMLRQYVTWNIDDIFVILSSFCVVSRCLGGAKRGIFDIAPYV